MTRRLPNGGCREGIVLAPAWSAFLVSALFGGEAFANEPKISPPVTVVISEFMATNDSQLQDLEGEYRDWVELYNYGSEPVELSDLFLTDSRKKMKKWRLPDRVLPGGEYVIIWESREGSAIRLNRKGDYLGLVDAEGQRILHDFGKRYPKQIQNISFGLFGSWKPGKPLSAFSGFLQVPTPKRKNSNALRGVVESVSLSEKRGFHESGFRLELTTKTPQATIRYTLNGSRPTAESGEVYEEPILIDRTSVLRVGAFKFGFKPSKIKTHTYLFSQDVVRQSPDGLPPEGFPYLWGENHVDYGIDPDVIEDPRFGDQFVDGLKSLPVISLVAELKDLFDAETGIYARAGEDGREWERPCSFEILNADGKDSLQVDAGLRIRGGFSRLPLNPKHAFRVFFRDEYGPAKLKAKLFPDGRAKAFDHIDLRTFQNYSWSYQRDPRAIFLRDQFNRDLQLAMGQPAARGEYYHLFLNGQYWGIYNTCERPKASYGVTYFGGKKSDYDAVKKGNTPGTRLNVMATDGNLEAWRRLWEQAKAGLESNEAYFKLLGRHPDGAENPDQEVLLDAENLIDYMLVIFYGGNLDAPVTYFGRNRSSNNWHSIFHREGRDGFQFFVWDAEHTFLDVNEDRTGPFPAGIEYRTSNPQYLWQQCLENAEFRMVAADRIHAAFFNGGVLNTDVIRKRFLARAAELELAVVCESARWGDVVEHFPGHRRPGEVSPDRVFTRLDWEREIDRVANDYMVRRSDVVLGQLYAQGLWPDVVPPRLNQHGGTVRTGFALAFDQPHEGVTVYVTLDGTDPREIGGDVSLRALPYRQPIPIDRKTEVKARSYRDGEWSALTHVWFKVTSS